MSQPCHSAWKRRSRRHWSEALKYLAPLTPRSLHTFWFCCGSVVGLISGENSWYKLRSQWEIAFLRGLPTEKAQTGYVQMSYLSYRITVSLVKIINMKSLCITVENSYRKSGLQQCLLSGLYSSQLVKLTVTRTWAVFYCCNHGKLISCILTSHSETF